MTNDADNEHLRGALWRAFWAAGFAMAAIRERGLEDEGITKPVLKMWEQTQLETEAILFPNGWADLHANG